MRNWKILKEIQSLTPSHNKYPADGLWMCSWEDGYCGTSGDLDFCIETVSNYILSQLWEEDPNLKTKSEALIESVRNECLINGSASGPENLWSIYYGDLQE